MPSRSRCLPRRDQVWLGLGVDVLAVLVVMPLAQRVTALLVERGCPPPVLDHPYAPGFEVLLCRERNDRVP